MFAFVDSIKRSLTKFLLRLYTSQSEIERECSRGHFAETTLAVARSLRLSKRLKNVAKEILQSKGRMFSISKASRDIIREKNILNANHASILTICLKDIYFVKSVIKFVEISRTIKVDLTTPGHRQLINEFWDSMMPNSGRTTPEGDDSRHVIDWTEVGFQSKSPETDFRGMGLFGLQQLAFLGKFENSKADFILRNCNHNRRFLPFAATGINITAYIMELIEGYRLHRILLNAFYHHQHELAKRADNTSSHTIYDTINSDDNNITTNINHELAIEQWGIDREFLQIGIDTINIEYCHIYFEFMKFWVKSDPRDIMEFQNLFSAFKKMMERERYREL